MKLLHLLCLLFVTQSLFAQIEIESKDAAAHVGEKVSITATVAQITDKSPKVIYLNIGAAYPQHDFAIVILPNEMEKFKDFSKYEGKKVHILGELELYPKKIAEGSTKKQSLQIVLKEVEQIEIVE